MNKKARSGIANPRQSRLPKGERLSAAALRLALFSSVAAGSLMLAGPAALANDCLLDGTTVTCTGDVSSGIYLTDPAITLNVYDVTTDINPADISGINLQTTDYIHANVQLGEHKIDVDWSDDDGHVASGIVLNAAADDKSADLVFQGAIQSGQGYGILLDGWAGSSVDSTGDITAKLDAINVHSAFSGKADVTSNGTLISTDGYGVRADGIGSVVVDLSGSVSSHLDGVKATATGDGDDATVVVKGDAAIESSDGYGIYADSSYHSVVVNYNGNVTGALGGIYAMAHGESSDAAVTVTSYGDITSSGGVGIMADSSYHSASVYSSGSIEAEGDGINVRTHGTDSDASTTITQIGNVTSHSGSAIVAASDEHSASIDSNGTINAYVDGLVAKTHGDNYDSSTTIKSVGDITATTGYGIYALSDFHSAKVESTGVVEAENDGIYVVTHGSSYDANSTVEQNGNVTSHSGSGIVAVSDFESASIDVSGNINAYVDGLVAKSHGEDSTSTSIIKSSGDIAATTGFGIYALSDFNSASVDSDGTIEAQLDGIHVTTHGANYDASSIVKQVGNVTSYGGSGIVSESDFHSATITVNGDIVADKDGLVALAHGTDNDASALITSVGNVTATNGYGIYAKSDNHAASVDSDGDVESSDDAISVIATGNNYDASALLTSLGNITSHNGRGLVATSDNYAAIVKSDGDVTSDGDGIVAISTGTDYTASAEVQQVGDVNSTNGYGIYVLSAAQSATVTLTGDVESAKDAIFAKSTGNGSSASVHVKVSGDLTSHEGYGIYALSARQGVTLDVTGDIYSQLDAVYAKATGTDVASAVHLTLAGDLTSDAGYGINATSANHGVDIHSTGDINSHLTGVYARSTGDNEDASVLLTLTGDITSDTGLGIYAESTNRGVVITSTGDIVAQTGGITAKSTGSVASSSVHVTHSGTIEVANGSGIYGYASNREVSISQTGDVTGGDYGLYAKSEGSSVDITLEDGTISAANIAAVMMDSITGNSFINRGTIEGGDALAISAKGWGGTTIKNYGTLTGDIEVDDVWGGLVNYGDALYNISKLSFENGGLLTNYGTLSPGGDGHVEVASIKGSLLNQDGTLVIDIDGDSSDRIDVSGTASVNGFVQLNFEDIKGQKSYTILTSAGLLDQDLQLTLVKTLLNQDSTISYVDGTDVVVDLKISYALNGVYDTNKPLSEVLEKAYEDGNTGLGVILAQLANLGTIEEYNAALDQLAGENYTQDTSSIRLANTAFTDRLFSCKVQDGAYMYSAEGECGWFSMAAGSFDRSSDIAGFDYSQDSQQIALGGQIALDADWRLGGAFGFTQYQGSNGLGATKDGAQYEAGGVLKYDHEGTVLSTAVSLGTMTADSVRHVDFGGLDEVLTGRATGSFGSLRFQASHTFDYGDFYLKPMADLNFTQVHQDEFVEQGGDAALDIEAHNQLITTLDPSLEIGGQVKVSETAVLRPYVRAGISVISGGDGEMTASFVEGEGSTFTISNSDDKLLGKVSAGADLLGLGEANFRLYYEGSFGETTKRQTVGLKIGMPF